MANNFADPPFGDLLTEKEWNIAIPIDALKVTVIRLYHVEIWWTFFQ